MKQTLKCTLTCRVPIIIFFFSFATDLWDFWFRIINLPVVIIFLKRNKVKRTEWIEVETLSYCDFLQTLDRSYQGRRKAVNIHLLGSIQDRM